MSKICQLYSGSSGNSIFIADKNTRLLIDAGVSAKRLEEGLAAIGEDAAALKAIFVTHEHSDHVKGLKVLTARYGIPVFTGDKILTQLFNEDKLKETVPVQRIQGPLEFDGIEITPFQNSHDSVECFGYRFQLKSGRSVSVCTDTGYITAGAKRVLPGSDLVFLESNHEITMLENGSYPYLLKQRILSRKGHLSNTDCADYAAELIKSGTTRLVLAHLSRENNYPDIARQTTSAVLQGAGFEENRDYRLAVSPPVNDRNPIIL